MTSLLDELIEEAALTWHRERDGLPTSIRRTRLLLICADLAATLPKPPAPPLIRPDRKTLAANDHSLT